MNILIHHQCPQCGAPADLEETDRLFTCEFCRVKSYLIETGAFHYLLPSRAPADKELIYLPYWRLKGNLFSSGPNGIQHRFTDNSCLSVDFGHAPFSLGFRSQALHMRFATAETPGRFIAPRTSARHMASQMIDRRFAEKGNPPFHTAYIGDSLTMIHAPFYWKNGLFDAVLNRKIGTDATLEDRLMAMPHEKPVWPVRFVAAICPSCGWDLQGHADSLTLYCQNCTTLWQATARKMRQIPFRLVPPRKSVDKWLPFWRIKTNASGVNLSSYGDLVRIANLPKVARKEWETRPFRFWVPAFKIRPKTFLQLAKYLTLDPPENAEEGELPTAAVHPVTLPVTEAVEGLKIILASFVKPQRRYLPMLPKIDLEPKKYALVFVPYTEGPHEWLHTMPQLSINKNQLTFSKNL